MLSHTAPGLLPDGVLATFQVPLRLAQWGAAAGRGATQLRRLTDATKGRYKPHTRTTETPLYGTFQPLREPPCFDSFFHLGDSVSGPHVPALSGALLRSRIPSVEPADRLPSFGGIGHLGGIGFGIRGVVRPFWTPSGVDPRRALIL